MSPPAFVAILLLVALAGAVDVFAILHLQDVFVAYMTGNTATLGMALHDGRWNKAAHLAIALGGFAAGVVLAAGIGPRLGRWRPAVVLGGIAALLATAALAWDGGRGDPGFVALVLPLALAMGALNGALHDDGGAGLTFITGTLVKLGRSLGGGRWRDAGTAALRWLALLGGAGGGAWLDRHSPAQALAVPAAGVAAAALVALAAALFQKRPRRDGARSPGATCSGKPAGR